MRTLEPAAFAPLGEAADAAAILERIEAAGIVGMGGAGYPTARKIREAIAGGADTVIGNGMASEPDASADRMLLREHGAAVAAGLGIVGGVLGKARLLLAVPVGGELVTPVVAVDLEVVEVESGYGAGDERRLTRQLAGRQVPNNGYPKEVGVLVLNVATLFAVFEAVALGRALERRLVAVDGTDRWVALGTPLADLPMDGGEGGFRINGALTGRPAPANAVVEAATFSVAAALPPALACIRCGWCAPACPVQLSPQRLHAAFEARVPDAAVLDCIECGACTAVCPSGIDLVGEFRTVKDRMQRDSARQHRADEARRRSAARIERLERQARERQARRAERLRTPRQWV